jgi:hypothetical protein
MKIPRSDYEQRRQAWHAALRQHGIDPTLPLAELRKLGLKKVSWKSFATTTQRCCASLGLMLAKASSRSAAMLLRTSRTSSRSP